MGSNLANHHGVQRSDVSLLLGCWAMRVGAGGDTPRPHGPRARACMHGPACMQNQKLLVGINRLYVEPVCKKVACSVWKLLDTPCAVEGRPDVRWRSRLCINTTRMDRLSVACQRFHISDLHTRLPRLPVASRPLGSWRLASPRRYYHIVIIISAVKAGACSMPGGADGQPCVHLRRLWDATQRTAWARPRTPAFRFASV